MTTMTSKVEEAESLKTAGNTYFQKGDIDNAIDSYTLALKCLEKSSPSEYKLLQCIILSNRVACYLKKITTITNNDNDKSIIIKTCVDDCTKGLKEVESMSSTHMIDDKSCESIREKLLYRRAKAKYEILTKESLNDAARDIMIALQINKHNKLAQGLLRSIKERHGEIGSDDTLLGRALNKLAQSEDDITNGKKVVDVDDRINNLKAIYHVVSQDVASNSMSIGRNKKNGINLLMSIALDKEIIQQPTSEMISNTNVKCRCLALQILSACCSYVPFVLNYYTYIRISDLSTIIMESCPNDPDVIIATIAVLLRLVLTLDEDDNNDDGHVDIHTSTAPSICQICITALSAFSPSSSSSSQDCIRIQHAIFDLLTAWISINHDTILSASQEVDNKFLENTQQSKYYKQKRSSHFKTEDEIRKMKPRELSNYKQKEYAYQRNLKKRACNNSMLFCNIETGGLDVLLNCAIQIQNYSVRREICIVISKLINAMDLDDEKEDVCEKRIKDIVLPIFNACTTISNSNDNQTTSNNNREEMKYDYGGVIIEEIHSDDDEDEHQNDDESIKNIMIKCQLISSLLLAVSNVGIWALEKWNNGKVLDQLQILVKSNNKIAMSIAAECLSACASIEKARTIITPLLQQGENSILQTLLQCDDGDIRSGAASTLAKMGLADKVMSHDEGEIMGLLQLAADLLEESSSSLLDDDNNNKDSITTNPFSSIDSSNHRLLKRNDDNNTVGATTTTIERAIELLSYLCSKTYIKEEITYGFQSPKSTKTVLQRLVELGTNNTNNASGSGGELSYAYGLASIFASIAVSIETLHKEAFVGKDITSEQYDQLQSMTLTDEEKELQEKSKEQNEEDTPKNVSIRIEKMAQCNVTSALVHIIDNNTGSSNSCSEATKDQIIIALMRMAVEPSIRGIMIQQGGLKACISIETGDITQMTEKGKTILLNARHCIAKLLVTTNPGLLTPVQRIGAIHPLIELIRDHNSSDLAIFEALLAICNIASLDNETKSRIVSEKGISTLSYAMFSDHKDVRRAATEAMSNLVPHPDVMTHLAEPEKLKLWLAFAADFDENYECARAAAGCLANATTDPKIANELVKLPHFKEQIRALLECGHLELMHRLLVILLNMLTHGGKCRTAVEETGAIPFCKAYLESYGGGGRSSKKDELDFSPTDQKLMEVTLDLSKEIVKYE